MIRIVLLGKMAAWCEPEIRARLRHPHELLVVPDAAQAPEAIEQADVIVGWPLSQEMAGRARSLRLLQASGAGIDGLSLDQLPPHVRVANTFHHEVAIAEYVLLMMLTLARRPHDYDQRLRQGNWRGSCIWGETPVLEELYGKVVLLIGLGHIAREVAQRTSAFGMHVTGVTRRPNSAEGLYSKVVPWSDWREELPLADFVVPTCPLTTETAGLIGTAEFARMRSSAFLINITRGRVVDEQALFDALSQRRIAGAAIDVWYQYPSDPASAVFPSQLPFHALDNVVLSPHNSGWTRRTIMGRIEDIAENINRLVEGGELLNVVR